jgi:hypothetical protein
MPYIGNEPADRFTSIPTVQQFNGDGSTTAFTLSRTVSSDQDILVSVDGVIQDTAAYAVSSGTTLTFSAAPSTGTANIFVNHLGLTIGSVVHPASSALVATTGTFTGTLGVTGVLTTTAATVFNGGFASPNKSSVLVPDGTGDDDWAFKISNLEATDGRSYGLKINAGSTTDEALLITDHDASNVLFKVLGNGAVTMPNQPAFQVKKNAAQNDFTENVTTVVTWETEVFDVGANFASNVFTAPVTGKYQLNAHLLIENVDTAPAYYQLVLITGNRNYFDTVDPGAASADYTYQSVNVNVLADMDAGDTATVTIYQEPSGTTQSDLNATTSVFSGYLVA